MKWIVLVSLFAATLVRQPAPVVRTRSGLVRGRVSENGRLFEYFGLPYGTVDDTNRFQAPLPPPTWEGIFEAQDENTWCPQAVYSVVIGAPNCLKLNIYTPAHAPSKPLPVMVYIHGGCFFGGSGTSYIYAGDFFAEQDVVFVGINYRLGVEGFLCLGIKEAPGNTGLKDQIAALRWIRDNIHAFGGNKDDVTLFGESAGAVSTSLLILAPAAKGLFHKAILQSGSSLAPWGLQHDPIQRANNLVKKFGFDTFDPHEIHAILSNKTARELISALQNDKNYCVSDSSMFVPCVEKEIEGVESTITKHPAEIIRSRNYTKLPMIVGHTDKEGILFVGVDYGTSLRNGSREIDPLTVLHADLEFPTEYDRNCTADRIRRHYFSSQDDMIMGMVDFYSDVYFKFPQLLEAEMYSRSTEQAMYYYMFRYSGYINVLKFISGFWECGGASHADELFYMFKPRSFPLPHRFVENDMIEKMVTMWTNFAKFGDPTPKPTRLLPFRWRASRESNPRALIIDTSLSTAPLWDQRTVAFWNETYNRYRRRDYGFKTKYNFMDIAQSTRRGFRTL